MITASNTHQKCNSHRCFMVMVFPRESPWKRWGNSKLWKRAKCPLCAKSGHPRRGRPRRSLRCLGFLNGVCGVADHVQHGLWLGEHRDVTGAQLDGCGAHALCNETLQFGLDGAIFSGHDVPTRLRPPSDTVDLLVEQVGHRCGLGRPHKLLLRLGQITRETSDTARLL